MARFGMVVDTRRCVGCMDCVVACKVENGLPEGACRNWIVQEVHGAFPALRMEIRSERCNHCDFPPCVDACPTGASHVTELGRTVQVDAELCVGCKACLAACPYGARFIDEERGGIADKCTFCLHRVAQGQLPACVAVCPAHALAFGDLDDPHSEVSRLLASRPSHTLLAAAGTGPRIHYLT